ncbi:MAG: hypothetical protein ACREL5_05720 [Gemmatimonadales bacterium]
MPRHNLSCRVVPLGSPAASDARLGADAAERLRMLAELSHMAWLESGRPFPRYTRATMPVRLSTLAEQDGPEDR